MSLRFKINSYRYADYDSIHEQSFLNGVLLRKSAKINQAIRYNTRQKKNKISPRQYN